MKNKKNKPQSEETFEVEMEVPVIEPGHPTGWRFVPCYTGSEEEARSNASYLKTNGLGGRLKRLDGTPDGELVEQWASIGRLEQATAQENPSGARKS